MWGRYNLTRTYDHKNIQATNFNDTHPTMTTSISKHIKIIIHVSPNKQPPVTKQKNTGHHVVLQTTHQASENALRKNWLPYSQLAESNVKIDVLCHQFLVTTMYHVYIPIGSTRLVWFALIFQTYRTCGLVSVWTPQKQLRRVCEGVQTSPNRRYLEDFGRLGFTYYSNY